MVGQSYLWASTRGAGAAAIAPLRKRFDEILALRRESELAVTARRLLAALVLVRRAVHGAACVGRIVRRDRRSSLRGVCAPGVRSDEGLPVRRDEHLFYRDSRFFDQRDAKGRKLFWSRGNGWVFAGVTRVLALLPANDPARPAYEILFREMAAKLRVLQKPDGYWAPSLLADPDPSPPEASGTGFFVYGLAWGVRTGLLDRATYEPALRRGWRALERAVHEDGMLGWVQQVSDRPDQVARARHSVLRRRRVPARRRGSARSVRAGATSTQNRVGSSLTGTLALPMYCCRRGCRMSEPIQNAGTDLRTVHRARPRVTPPIEAIRDCITPILTSTLIARSVCDDRRAQLALEIIERQMHRLVHLLKEVHGLDTRPRFD